MLTPLEIALGVYPYPWARALAWLNAFAPSTTDPRARHFARRRTESEAV